MPNKTSDKLKQNSKKIMDLWEVRALDEIKAANHQETLALRDSLPEYLTQMVDALKTTIDRTAARVRFDKNESTRIGKKHGHERAGATNYTMDQMITEYHILRQVIFDVLEEEEPINTIEREVIICSIEQAVNDAATQFSDTLRDLQEKLSHTLAHDLRNPLTSAKFSTELILRKPNDAEGTIIKANRISHNLSRIDKMITELLDASRLKSGAEAGLDFEELDLDWLVKEVAFELNIIYEKRFQVKSSGACKGMWNEDGLRRLIENLSTNAIKYGKQNTPILFNLEQDEKSAILSVHNEGEPIELKEQTSLFEKFKRARSAQDKIGWGLGLTMVKSMVDAHKGIITVQSDKNSGTTFKITIPKVRI